MSWSDVDGWSVLGGAKLGTSRFSPSNMDLEKIEKSLEKYKIKTLVMIGGWDGYRCMSYLKKHKKSFPYLARLNILLVPSTISNNLPCTQYSIGADTALNSIIRAVDKIKESAIAHRRIFVIEVMGAHCGYLCSMSAFSTGAEKTFLPEFPASLKTLQEDLNDVKDSFAHAKPMALFFTTENSSKVFDTKFLAKLFKAESGGDYDVRVSILGHLQQGGTPSPMDRFLGAEVVGKCLKLIENTHKNSSEDLFNAVGFQHGIVTFHEASHIEEQMDTVNRRPKEQWWTLKSYVLIFLFFSSVIYFFFPKRFFHISRQYAEWREKPEVYSEKNSL